MGEDGRIERLLGGVDAAGIAAHYGLSEDGVRKLLADLTQALREQFGIEGDDREVGQEAGMPAKVVRRLRAEGVLAGGAEDGLVLEALAALWGRAWYLRGQLAGMSRRDRLQLAFGPRYAQQWERYVYTRYLLKPEGGRRMKVESLVEEVVENFPSLAERGRAKVAARIREIRKSAADDKRYAREAGIDLSEYARKRTEAPAGTNEREDARRRTTANIWGDE